MQLPYVDRFAECLHIAQGAVALAFTAVVAARPLRSRAASCGLVVAMWMAALFDRFGPWLAGAWTHTEAAPPPSAAAVLSCSACVAAASLLAGGLWTLGVVATLGVGLLAGAALFFTDSLYEVAGLHLAFYGALYGAATDAAQPPVTPAAADRDVRDVSRAGDTADDVVVLACAFVIAALVASRVLNRYANSGDEWAYTYQADLFAHLRAYGEVPSCPSIFRNYWVFFYEGRAFGQYTPGWPLAMAPFQLAGVPWLASPFYLALLAVGVARLARRLLRESGRADPAEARTAGWIAAAACVLGPAMLLTGASHYAHAFVCASFAWAVESACAAADTRAPARSRLRAAALLGLATAWGCIARAADGALLSVFVAVYVVDAIARRRLDRAHLLAAAAPFAVVVALALVILRLQLGAWLTTGYALGAQMNGAWAAVDFSVPKPNEYRFGVPLATGSYCWWPASPALGAAGLFAARGRARGIALMLGGGALCTFAFLVFVTMGRYHDSGYGPRYTLAAVVPMAVGTGVIMARAATWARARPRIKLGAVLLLAAVAGGALLVAPRIYPRAYRETRKHSATLRAVQALGLRDAVVVLRPGDVGGQPWDMTQNLPSRAPDAAVLVTVRSEEELACARATYPTRSFFRAIYAPDVDEVRLEPLASSSSSSPALPEQRD